MAKTKNRSTASMENIYSLDGKVPLLKAVPFGLQHVLAMFVANIAPIMIVTGASGLSTQETASLIQTAMIMAGIGTLVQLFAIWKLGARLPIVMGISFTFVSVFCYIGPIWGYGAILATLPEAVLGFTQVPDMFNIFPSMVRTIFAENCVAVVFLTAIIMNLIMPKDRTVQE